MVLLAIGSGCRTCHDINDVTKLADTTIHHHLTELRRCGFANKDQPKAWSRAYYTLTPEGERKARAILRPIISSRQEAPESTKTPQP